MSSQVNPQVNPYAPPTARVEDSYQANSEAEAIRQEHIKHEASIRSVGVLYYIGGFFMGIAALALLAAGMTGEQAALGLGIGIAYLILGVLSVAVARGVRRFQPWARVTCIVLACIGLLGFPLGTLINGYILYLLLSAKGKRIFEPDYQDIVLATPHIKYKTSAVVWVFVGLLILALIGIVAAVVIPMLGR